MSNATRSQNALDGRVFVFTGATLNRALNDWYAEQLAAYPHREEQIRITMLAMQDFFESAHIGRHKMVLGQQNEVGR
jgi:hypothetical protein